MMEREFWLAVREALLALIEAVECLLGLKPRTSEIRKEWKRHRR